MAWFKKARQPPRAHPDNPGRGPAFRVAFSNGERAWEESGDLIDALGRKLRALGHDIRAKRAWLELGDFILVPQVVNVTPHESSGVQTLSTIQVSHPVLVPEGVFEYQHSTGDDARGAFASGFQSWAETDLAVFLDALRPTPTKCMFMDMQPGEAGSSLPAPRRIVLGPTLRMMSDEAVRAASATEDEHPFCPCCLFTQSFDAYRPQIDSTQPHGLRFFALRNQDGNTEADCRVDGVDWPAGAAALAKYAESWPLHGVEYRKQFALIYTPAESA